MTASGASILHVQAQFLQHGKQLAPLHGLPAPLDLAEEVLAHANAFGDGVLTQALTLCA